MIYLDHNATTPLDPRVRARMDAVLNHDIGNPSSIHAWGRRARGEIDLARDQVADLLGARPGEIIFTAGGTESNNLGLLGLALAHESKGHHVITTAIEHHAVLHAAEFLHHRLGWELTILPVDGSGRVDPDALRSALRPTTTLVSIMSANNETGTKQPVTVLAEICRDAGVLFHTDAVQSAGKEALSTRAWPVAALSFCAHKFYGPPGVGVLFLREGLSLQPLAHGGAHENQRRPGTENTPAIAGLAAAFQIAQDEGPPEDARLFPLVEILWEKLSDAIPGLHRNGHPHERIGNTLNLSVEGCQGESLLMGLDLEGLAVSSGSACMVGSVRPSHVLLAMGVPAPLAGAAIRLSLGKSSQADQLDFIVERFARTVLRQRSRM